MATGASGSFSYRASGGGNADYYLDITWQQEYTPGNNYSDVKVSAKIRRSGGSAQGGTWYAWSDGGISVNGSRVISWYEKTTTGSFPYSGDTQNLGSGSVRVYHTNATSVTLESTAIDWENTSYSSASFSFAAKSETLSLQAVPQPFTLTLSAGTGANIGVNRTSSPTGQGTGWLSSGAAIYAGDVLQITGSADTGYAFGGLTVNGTGFSSGGSVTVSGNVTVAASASLKTYGLTISPAAGSWITVTRGGTALSNGATIYHFDTLVVTAGADSGHELTGLTVNGAAFNSGGSVTVSGNVTVVTTTKQMGGGIIGGEKYLPMVGGADGKPVRYLPMVGAADGSQWILLV